MPFFQFSVASRRFFSPSSFLRSTFRNTDRSVMLSTEAIHDKVGKNDSFRLRIQQSLYPEDVLGGKGFHRHGKVSSVNFLKAISL